MAGSNGNSDGSIIAGINVTPLVNVNLVLLIIFIVTAKIVVAPTVPMELPQTSETQKTQVIFSIIVPAANPMLVNKTTVSEDAAVIALTKDAARTDSDVRAVINANKTVPHHQIIHILNLLKREKMSHIAFEATSEETETH